jgi:hypothetical protein
VIARSIAPSSGAATPGRAFPVRHEIREDYRHGRTEFRKSIAQLDTRHAVEMNIQDQTVEFVAASIVEKVLRAGKRDRTNPRYAGESAQGTT